MAKSRAKKNPIRKLDAIGGEKAAPSVLVKAMSSDRDVTDVDDAELGAYIKQTVRNGFTCVEYKAGDRIMLSVHG